MPISNNQAPAFHLTSNLAYRGRQLPWLQPWICRYTRWTTDGNTGGLRFIESDEALYKRLAHDLGRPLRQSLAYYIAELLDDKLLEETYFDNARKRNITKYKNWPDRLNKVGAGVVLYYALIREMEPRVIVETGTATGSMTSLILAAINRNGCGQLISIDLPPKAGERTMDLTLEPSEIGYFIPRAYQGSWRYIEADAKTALPDILAKHPVDFFIHDSLHTRSHMLFEYTVARNLMPEKSIIASDDILWNNAFTDFLKTNKIVGYATFSNPNLGIFVNTFDEFEKKMGLGIAHAEG